MTTQLAKRVFTDISGMRQGLIETSPTDVNTMKTPNGVNIGLDYAQEKYVRLVRAGTGKIKRHGNKGKIEHTSFCRMNKQQKEGIKQEKKYAGDHDYDRTTGTKKNLVQYDALALVKLMCGLETIGAWSEDPEKKSREKGTDAFYSLREVGKQLPPELLYALIQLEQSSVKIT